MDGSERAQMDRIEAKLDIIARWMGGPMAREFGKIGVFAKSTPVKVRNALRKAARDDQGG